MKQDQASIGGQTRVSLQAINRAFERRGERRAGRVRSRIPAKTMCVQGRHPRDSTVAHPARDVVTVLSTNRGYPVNKRKPAADDLCCMASGEQARRSA
jgi:hypothetical protein